MGSYTFKWENPTDDVSDILVTGSFDGWTKSVKLDKQGNTFQKTVDFAEKDASSKIYYKFVVDNNWTINESYPHEADHEGNVNNFLTPDDLTKSKSVPVLAAAPFINTVTPESTTVAEMGKKNNKKNKAANKPAVAAASAEAQPDTTVAEAALATDAPVTAAVESAAPEVNEPAEATATPSDVPGGFPVTPSNEAADLEDKTVSVNPLPATTGTGNPIKLAPGEKIPDSITSQNVNEHVKLDKESYEKSDALPTAPALSTDVPPVSGTMIPESSLPMGDKTDVTNPTINSVGAGSTTAALAGQVPLEPKVPEVVKESQEKANVAPEASAVPEEVKEKAEVEQEIKDKVPEAPATSVGTAGVGTEKNENTGTVLGAAAATGGAAVAAAVAAVTKFSEDATPAVNDAKNATAETVNKNLPETVKDKLPESAKTALATDKEASPLEKVSPEVPKEVKESIAEAKKSPEAAANTSAVEEKKEVESELLSEVKKTPAVDGAAKVEAKATEAAPAAATTEASTTTPAANGATGAETKASEPAASTAAANGNGTETKPAEGGAAQEKKKSRLSVMFSKLKSKLK